MIKAEIDPRDLMELRLDLHRLKPINLLRDDLRDMAYFIEKAVKPYPPVPENSHYIRTGNLYESWYHRANGDLEVEVGNLAIYAGYVQGYEQIAYHAKTGWLRLRETAESMIEGFIEKINRKIDLLWRP